jgi:hypothetical protein
MNEKFEWVLRYKEGVITGSFYDAVYQAVKGLLYRRYYDVNNGKLTEPCIATDTAVNALNSAIGHGGGHTLSPHVGNYWFFEYWPGIKASLCRSEGEKIINEKVSRSLIIKVAEECLKEYRGQNVQLSLF